MQFALQASAGFGFLYLCKVPLQNRNKENSPKYWNFHCPHLKQIPRLAPNVSRLILGWIRALDKQQPTLRLLVENLSSGTGVTWEGPALQSEGGGRGGGCYYDSLTWTMPPPLPLTLHLCFVRAATKLPAGFLQRKQKQRSKTKSHYEKSLRCASVQLHSRVRAKALMYYINSPA